jgi:hypothetical protein
MGAANWIVTPTRPPPNAQEILNNYPKIHSVFGGGVPSGGAEGRAYLFFFSFFCLRFSLMLSFGFFLCSLLPLSFFPTLPMTITPFLLVSLLE